MDSKLARLCFNQPTPPDYHLLSACDGSELEDAKALRLDSQALQIPGDNRWVVIEGRDADPLEVLPLTGALISQLRVGVTVVLDPKAGPAWLEGLSALGFVYVGQASPASHIYRYSLDDANPRREWNTPEHWAHPEQFKNR